MKSVIFLKVSIVALTIIGGALHSNAIKSNLRYYKELHTLTERGLKGKVKKVVTYDVPFTREWGEIKLGQKEPIDSSIYDTQGRALLLWSNDKYGDGGTYYFSWNGNERRVLYRTDAGDKCDYNYVYEYDASKRIKSVTEKVQYDGRMSSKNSMGKVAFEYNMQGKYRPTVYESIDDPGHTWNFLDVDEDRSWDTNLRREAQYVEYDFDRYENWKALTDENGNWIEAQEYDKSGENWFISRIIIREIEYYRPGETSAPSIPNSPFALEKIVENGSTEELKPYQTAENSSGNIRDDGTIYTTVETMPQYPGGEAALNADISKNIQYPSSAQKNGLGGKVVVQFVVTKTGLIGDVKVARGCHPELDKEACRVVKTLKKFSPGIHNGKPVNVWYTSVIRFRAH